METAGRPRLEVRRSASGRAVPELGGVLLHSAEDPVREAAETAAKHEDRLRANPFVLVLGAGFGYHVAAIEAVLARAHGRAFRLAAVEPHGETLRLGLAENPPAHPGNTTHHTAAEPSLLYRDGALVDVLLKGPAVVTHPPSMAAHGAFFKGFVTHRAPDSVHEYLDRIEDEALKSHLAATVSDDPRTTLARHVENLRRQDRRLAGHDHLLIALAGMRGTHGTDADHQP